MSLLKWKASAARTVRGWGGIAAFAVVAPMIGLLVANVVQPIAGPASAAAGQSSLADRVTPRDLAPRTHAFRPITSEEADKLAEFEAATISRIERTPLVKLAGEPSAVVARIQIIEDAPATIMPPTVAVTSIMASKGLPLAVVGGKLLRVGDEVSPGWSIGTIDAEAGTVTILHQTGVEHLLSLRP